MQPKYHQTKYNQTEQVDIIEEGLTTECKNTLLAIIATCQVLIVSLQVIMIIFTICDKLYQAIRFLATIIFQ